MSRWKLIAALAGVIALVLISVVVLVVTTSQRDEQPPTRTTAPPRVQAPVDTSSPEADHDENIPANAGQAAQLEVANAYIDAFLKPGSPDERAARLKDVATPALVQTDKLIDPRNLPDATRQKSAALDDNASEPNRAVAWVELSDGSWWNLTLVSDATAPKKWRVSLASREGH